MIARRVDYSNHTIRAMIRERAVVPHWVGVVDRHEVGHILRSSSAYELQMFCQEHAYACLVAFDISAEDWVVTGHARRIEAASDHTVAAWVEVEREAVACQLRERLNGFYTHMSP